MVKAIAYRLEPVQPSMGGMATACMMYCGVTGLALSGSGGGGNYISPEVWEVLQGDGEVRELIRQKVQGLGSHPVA